MHCFSFSPDQIALISDQLKRLKGEPNSHLGSRQYYLNSDLAALSLQASVIRPCDLLKWTLHVTSIFVTTSI